MVFFSKCDTRALLLQLILRSGLHYHNNNERDATNSNILCEMSK